MKTAGTNLPDWQERCGAEEACAQARAQRRWAEGFRCPRCGRDHGYAPTTRHRYGCSRCHYRAPPAAGALFHSTNLSPAKWFRAIYPAVPDKGGIPAMRLSKQIGASWITSSRMPRKIRIAMGHRDGLYRLHDLTGIDDAPVSGRRSGKRGRGAEGKPPVLAAVENPGQTCRLYRRATGQRRNQGGGGKVCPTPPSARPRGAR